METRHALDANTESRGILIFAPLYSVVPRHSPARLQKMQHANVMQRQSCRTSAGARASRSAAPAVVAPRTPLSSLPSTSGRTLVARQQQVG